MRIHGVIACGSVAILTSLGHAMEPVTLSLRWLDRHAYVANVSIDGTPTFLQVGTYNSDSWVACSRFGNRTCDVSRSIGRTVVENDVIDVSFLYSKTLKITDVDGVKSVEYANGASMYRAETSANEGSRLPLVGADTQGVLGFGPYNGLTCSGLNGSCGNISLYLSSSSDGAGSFVTLGGDTNSEFDPNLLRSRGITARYAMPVRATDEQGWESKRWHLSLIGVRFGESKALYPRSYESGEVPGGDVTALVSLNHATLQLTMGLHTRFQSAYLASCQLMNRYPMGWFYECDGSVINSLPRLSLFVGDKVFYLDPIDYTYTTASEFGTTTLVVLISWGEDWVLGAPFLRKFPTVFSVDADTIDVFCTGGSSCRIRSEPLDRAAVDMSGKILDSSGSGSQGMGSRTIYGPATTSPPSYGSAGVTDSTLWILWIAKSLGFLMVFILVVRSVRRCRGRRQEDRTMQLSGQNADTGTVASERDLEEAKEDLRRMLAEEEATAAAIAASRNDPDFVALQSPAAREPRRGRLNTRPWQ